MRIVWHYEAHSEQRTFHIHYRLRGLAVAYDDVVDVNFRVWGDEWESGLARLQATLMAPGTIRRAWGHPVHVRGDVRIDEHRRPPRDRHPAEPVGRAARSFRARRSPRPPRCGSRAATASRGSSARRSSSAQAAEHDREKIDDAVDHLPRTLLLLALLGLVPATALVYGVYRFGRELEVGYDREYEQEPPSELDPALVPSLVAQRTRVGSNEFTATLFDLIRRGLQGRGVTTERSTWAGMRSSRSPTSSSRAAHEELTEYEQAVADVVDDVLSTA